MPHSYKRLFTSAKVRKNRKKPRDSRRVLLEQLEDRNLLAGDIDLSPHLMAEGEGPSCPEGLNYPLIAAYTGNLPELAQKKYPRLPHAGDATAARGQTGQGTVAG